MSIRYIAAVLDRLPHLNASEALVLIVLADCAGDDVPECWPSMRTISRRARCDERSARRILRRLELKGLIETSHGGHQYGANTANAYRLRFNHDGERLEGPPAPPPELSTRGARRPPSTPKLSTRGTGATRKGDRMSPQGGPYAPPSVIEPSLNQRAFEKRLKPENGDNPRPVTKAEAQQSLAALHEELRKRSANA